MYLTLSRKIKTNLFIVLNGLIFFIVMFTSVSWVVKGLLFMCLYLVINKLGEYMLVDVNKKEKYIKSIRIKENQCSVCLEEKKLLLNGVCAKCHNATKKLDKTENCQAVFCCCAESSEIENIDNFHRVFVFNHITQNYDYYCNMGELGCAVKTLNENISKVRK